MYDIVSHKVNKLKGELSSAFVNVAESNANDADDMENVSISDSGIFEQMRTKSYDENSAAENFDGLSSTEKYKNKIIINSGYSVIKS